MASSLKCLGKEPEDPELLSSPSSREHPASCYCVHFCLPPVGVRSSFIFYSFICDAHARLVSCSHLPDVEIEAFHLLLKYVNEKNM